MRRHKSLMLAAALLPVFLTGCESGRELLGLTKHSPDEFQVVSRAPLSMPPDYNLRPPAPGAPRPQEGTARDQAELAVFGPGGRVLSADQIPSIGEGEQTSAQSAGEAALLQSAGTTGIDPNIRTTVDFETADDEAGSRSFVDSLIFWRQPEPYGTVVDPNAEAKRLQENQALGQPIATGETPTIVRKRKGLLEGLF